MARKVQISQEIILKAALEMLIEHGYSFINIKTLSGKIGCSTQPLVWQFDNMEELRKALSDYALNYADQKIYMSQKMDPSISAMTTFFNNGMAFIDMAFDEPHLFRYLYTSGESGHLAGGFKMLSASDENTLLVEQIAEQLKISSEKAGVFCKNMMIYTYGLASVIASGLIKSTKEEVGQMMRDSARGLMLQVGAEFHSVT